MRKLDEVDLWEISIVTFPLLAGARVHAVKQAPSQPQAVTRADARGRLSGARCAETPQRRYARCAATVGACLVHPLEIARVELPRLQSELLRLKWLIAARNFERAAFTHLRALKARFNENEPRDQRGRWTND